MLVWRYSRTDAIIMRVYLPKKKQRKLINKILSKISVKEASKICKLSERTIRDWRRGKFLMDFKVLKILSGKTGIKIPSGIKLRDQYWYTSKGSSSGGKAVFEKYGRIGGDPGYRKKKWYEWWKKEGKYRIDSITNCKLIKEPKFSKELAEFVGIVLGDGNISQHQMAISLHSKDDKAYGKFVVGLIQKLFNVPVGVSYDKRYLAADFVVSRSKLVHFCIEKLGLKRGNKVKQQVDIPRWIKKDKLFSIACARGLVDTDGCVFNHRYKVNGKLYSYKKLAFSNHSKPLIDSVFRIFKKHKLNPRITKSGKDVRLESKEDIQRYFLIFSTHNPKYLKNIRK